MPAPRRTVPSPPAPSQTHHYVGDQATWNPHVANMFNNKSLTGHVTAPDLAVDGPIACDMVPRVWP